MARRPTRGSGLFAPSDKQRARATDQIFRAKGLSGPAGPTGPTGRDSGFKYTYIADTTATDPGSGNVKFNAAVTSMYLSKTDADGRSLSAYLATIDDSTSGVRGHLVMRKEAGVSVAVFTITGALTDNGTWITVPVTSLVWSGVLATDVVELNFSRTGDKGDVGATGGVGPSGPSGAGWLAPCRVATTANVATLAGGAPNTVDGVPLALNDRVLVKDQTTASQNGIYTVTTLGTGANGTWARATDADAVGELVAGTTVSVNEGTLNGDSDWTITTNGVITPGTTAHTWNRVAAIDFGLVTALPASPPNGSFCTYTDSLSAPTYRWRLQYNASSASSSKWECIGGTPIVARADAQRTLTNQTTYANLPTDPMAITAPLAGDYDITIEGDLWTGTGLTAAFLSYAIGATAASDAWAITGSTTQNVVVSCSKTTRQTGVAAAASIAEKGKTSTTNTGTFQERRLRVMPVRVG